MTIQVIIPSDFGVARAGARAELLEPALTKALRTTVQVRVAAEYGEILQSIRDASVDLAWAPPTICARAAAAATFLARVERRGKPSYRAAVLSATPELRAGALRGAWVEPLSAAGCVLARAWLTRVKHRTVSDTFVGSYRDAAERVVSGAADVCSVYSTADDAVTARAGIAQALGVLAARLFVVGLTERAPGDAWIVTQKPDEAQRARLVAMLIGHAPAELLDACEGDALVVGRVGDYAALR